MKKQKTITEKKDEVKTITANQRNKYSKKNIPKICKKNAKNTQTMKKQRKHAKKCKKYAKNANNMQKSCTRKTSMQKIRKTNMQTRRKKMQLICLIIILRFLGCGSLIIS